MKNLKHEPPAKIQKLIEVLKEHFARFAAIADSERGRVIIFSQYRDSVAEIVSFLREVPGIRPRAFVGQGF